MLSGVQAAAIDHSAVHGAAFDRLHRETPRNEVAEPAEQALEAPGAAAAAEAGANNLSEEEQRVVAELQRTDREVRAHENAHLAAAGGLARGVSFTFATGPDGRQYAVAGEVSIDTSPESGDPEATIRKAQQIRAAANAPANPSGQDRQVAAQAAQMEATARAELSEQQREERERQTRGDQARSFEQPSRSRTAQILDLVA